ncbi:MAG: UbiA prenyltransferase family protein [Planctomycetota bacterium]|nr:UbiA prenyltransferase family protein [Planctomycetota bacterium]
MTSDLPAIPSRTNIALSLLRLARPKQWAKGVFVVLGPLYALADEKNVDWAGTGLAFLAFGLASSGCYIVNDLRDRDLDRQHPRKKHRPIASGAVSPGAARLFAAALLAAAMLVALLVAFAPWNWAPVAAPPAGEQGSAAGHADRLFPLGPWVPLFVGGYIANVVAYSMAFKRVVMLDVISLASGFVLRVLGGCAAGGVEPSTWLLNCTFFVSMFLAFSKRLGERRSLGDHAASARGVLGVYTDDLLRMAVVVTAVASLITYAGYVQARDDLFRVLEDVTSSGPATWGFNLLWPTMIPATFALLRCIVMVERGRFDDPTELAFRDRGFQLAIGIFAAWTLGAMLAAQR